jgi:Na+(H+)/acetate symporter ActP
MRKPVLMAALTIGLLMIPFLVYAEIYKWVDEKGTVHFTDDNSTIPEKYGQQVERRSLPEDSKPITEEKKTESKTAGIPLSSPEVQDTPLLFSGMISTVGAGTIVVTGEG